jgi:hypothetical protein
VVGPGLGVPTQEGGEVEVAATDAPTKCLSVLYLGSYVLSPNLFFTET